MDEKENCIRAACPLFACRLCRTKTGWPHQRWCACRELTGPGCAGCRYHDPKRDECVHPARKGVLLR